METQRENPITGKEGSPIDLDVAANWTKNYRDKHPKETISQFFGKEILEKILTQENCLGIRFYYAYDKPVMNSPTVYIPVVHLCCYVFV